MLDIQTIQTMKNNKMLPGPTTHLSNVYTKYCCCFVVVGIRLRWSAYSCSAEKTWRLGTVSLDSDRCTFRAGRSFHAHGPRYYIDWTGHWDARRGQIDIVVFFRSGLLPPPLWERPNVSAALTKNFCSHSCSHSYAFLITRVSSFGFKLDTDFRRSLETIYMCVDWK